MISSKTIFSLIFYIVFDQKFVPKIFSTKIIFARNIFVFIENFCIRRVMKKCFSLCIANVFNVRERAEFILSSKGEHLTQVKCLLLGHGDF